MSLRMEQRQMYMDEREYVSADEYEDEHAGVCGIELSVRYS